MEIKVEQGTWDSMSQYNAPTWSVGKMYAAKGGVFVVGGPNKQWVRVTSKSAEEALMRLAEQVDDSEWLRQAYVKFKRHSGVCAVLAANKDTPASVLDLLGTSDYSFDDPETRLIIRNVQNNPSTTPETRKRVEQVEGIREVLGPPKSKWKDQVFSGKVDLSAGVLEVMEALGKKIQEEESRRQAEEAVRRQIEEIAPEYQGLLAPLLTMPSYSALSQVFQVQKMVPDLEGPSREPAPVGYRYHNNGGGLVALTAKVDATSFVSAGSKIEGEAEVSSNCRIEGFSIVRGGAKISDHVVVRGSTLVEGNAYVSAAALLEDAEVSGAARITGPCFVGSGTLITEKAVIEGSVTVVNAQVRGHAQLRDKVEIRGDANRSVLVGGVARMEDKAKACGRVEILDNAKVKDRAKILGYAKVRDGAVIQGRAMVAENAEVTGDASLDDQARVSGHAHVTDKARIEGNAEVTCNALVSGEAYVCSESMVGGNASVSGCAKVGDRVVLSGNARVGGEAILLGGAGVSEEASVSGKAEVDGMAQVRGHAEVSGSAVIQDQAVVEGYAKISGNASVMGNATVRGHAFVHEDVDVTGDSLVEEDATFGGQTQLKDYGVDAGDADPDPGEDPPAELPQETATVEPNAADTITSAFFSSLVERAGSSFLESLPDEVKLSIASATGSALAKSGGLEGLSSGMAAVSLGNAVHTAVEKVLKDG